MPDTNEIADQAARYFNSEGHNCAQAVLRAVAENHAMACPACIPAMALAMGGGVGHTGSICGAISGGVMAIGLAVDRTGPRDILARKRAAYTVAGLFVKDFAAHFRCTDCRDILGFDWSEPGSIERFQRDNFLQTKCVPCVRWAAENASRLVAGLLKA
jgi:C_GCAxxG_C_C family probable redox protein